jgi:hypothetical protein
MPLGERVEKWIDNLVGQTGEAQHFAAKKIVDLNESHGIHKGQA